MMDAQVSVAGWAGTSVEVRQAEGSDGAPWAHFRLAYTPSYQRDGQWHDRETVWFSVNCHRGLAENVAASVRKGDPVVVGRLETRLRTDRQTGSVEPMQVLVAKSVGHDLSRGTADFTKRARAGATNSPDQAAKPDSKTTRPATDLAAVG